MNWDAISAISESLGVIFLLISIIYLAIQIRHNTQAIQGSTIHSITQTQQSELRWASDISEEWTKAIESPSELSSSEAWKMSTWLTSAFAARQNEFIQYKKGLMDEEIWKASEGIVLILLSMPWTRNWWASYGKKSFSTDFVALVENILKDGNFDVIFTEVLPQLKTGGFKG